MEMAVALAESGLSGITITAAPGSDETIAEIEQELEQAKATLKKSGIEVNAILSDVGVAIDCKRAIEAHMDTFPSLDILINNAGKAGRYAHLGDTNNDISSHDPAGMSAIIATNLSGPYFMLHHALPYMRRLKWGRIINVSKRTESMHRKAWTPYGPTKAALEAATIAWAESLAETGITVNTLSPGGAVNTKFGTGRITGHGIDPQKIRPMTVWLASCDSDEFNGCRFVADRWDPGYHNRGRARLPRESDFSQARTRHAPQKSLVLID